MKSISRSISAAASLAAASFLSSAMVAGAFSHESRCHWLKAAWM